MSAKWAWLRGKYPTLPVDPEYADVLSHYRDLYRDKTPEQLAALLNELDEIKTIQERFVSSTNAQIVAAERLLVDLMVNKGIERIKVGGYSFAPKPEPVAKVENQSEWLEHVKEEMPDILSVNHQTMSAIVRRALEAGADLPPGISVEVRDTISRKKG